MRIAKGWAPVIGIGVMILVVGVAMASGYWSTQGRFVSGGGGGQSRQGDVAERSLGPAELRGWMTIGQAATGLGVDSALLMREAGLSTTTPLTTPLKELDTLGTSMSEFRGAAERLLARIR